METRALAISFFYAVGTGLGGAIGPLLFGKLIEQSQTALAWGYALGAGLMIVGGVIHLLFGVEAAKKNLEDIAQPLSAEDDDERSDRFDRTGGGLAPRVTGAA
jgi:MFS family permease